uniref:Uncharacterized protein n=1 Tax=Anguilla anguilla TaxID=7936 RepID=A0A0E9V772_ANGAN
MDQAGTLHRSSRYM